MTSIEIEEMRPADIEEASRVLSFAMLSNPIHVAVYQGKSKTERQQIEKKFTVLLRGRPEEVIISNQGSQIIGVCRFYICRGNRRMSQDVWGLMNANAPESSSWEKRRQALERNLGKPVSHRNA